MGCSVPSHLISAVSILEFTDQLLELIGHLLEVVEVDSGSLGQDRQRNLDVLEHSDGQDRNHALESVQVDGGLHERLDLLQVVLAQASQVCSPNLDEGGQTCLATPRASAEVRELGRGAHELA